MAKKPKTEDDWRIAARQRGERVALYVTMLREAPLAHLVELHRDLLPVHHAAILAEDMDAARDCLELHDAIVTVAFGSDYWQGRAKRHRGYFSCWADAEKGLAEINGAPDGEIPMWGQKGRFLIEVEGMLIDVHHGGHSPYGGGFRVVDRSKPFLSQTGYRSTCSGRREVWGYTVDEYYRELAMAVIYTDSNGKRLKSPQVYNGPFGLKWFKGGKNEFREALPDPDDSAYHPGGFLHRFKPTQTVFREERGGQLAMF